MKWFEHTVVLSTFPMPCPTNKWKHEIGLQSCASQDPINPHPLLVSQQPCKEALWAGQALGVVVVGTATARWGFYQELSFEKTGPWLDWIQVLSCTGFEALRLHWDPTHSSTEMVAVVNIKTTQLLYKDKCVLRRFSWQLWTTLRAHPHYKAEDISVVMWPSWLNTKAHQTLLPFHWIDIYVSTCIYMLLYC